MKKNILILLLLAFLSSCEKEIKDIVVEKGSRDGVNAKLNGSRLSFKSYSELNQVFEVYKGKTNTLKMQLKALGFDRIKKTDIPFVKLAMADQNSNDITSQNLITEDDLIDDPIIEEIVNNELEIEVENIIYKITPYGTLFSPKDNYDRMTQVVEEFSMDRLTMYDAINYDIYENPLSTEDDIYEVAPGVLLYDTYEVVKTKDEVPNSNSSTNDVIKVAASANINNTDVNNGEYSSLPVIKYGKHTFLGKIWSGIFGGANNEVYTANFSNKRRIKVSLYNRNYIFRKVIGLRVKTQKKNWIGWSTTAADEIRLGWDGISFTKDDKITPANPWDAMQKVLEPYRASQFQPNPDWDPLQRPTPLKYEFNLLGSGVSLDLSRGFQQATKLVYDQTKRFLNKNIPKNQTSTVSLWLDSQLKTPVIIAGPNEIRATNKEELIMELDSYTDFVFSFSIGANGNINWTKTALNTVDKSKNASKIVMQYASIYGVARFGNTWKGAVIEKSEN
ncbi:hypothetical protein ACR777_15925 [Sphingobacterium spiritivorum]|uniref:hypothetical protein n=1 Tax=Sphingobacterium spiritivorum TaxID=258 RepID=UPI003DA604B1